MDGNTILANYLELSTCYVTHNINLDAYIYDCGLIISTEYGILDSTDGAYAIILQAHTRHHKLNHNPEDDFYRLASRSDGKELTAAWCECLSNTEEKYSI